MGLSGVLEWWQEWQLRILVLASTAIQLLLYLFANRRKHVTSSRFRSVIWLAYLGSDAIAIYALATLFNRHKNQDSCSSTAQGSRILEVVWAPILLIHLGGQDSITAYNIEDNELWKRNVVTMVSQVTVSIYVFCKSWPGGDKRLLQAAIVLFVSGVLKCIEKPWALRSASINSLVSSKNLVLRTGKGNEQWDSISLESYVKKAKKFFMGNGDPSDANENTSDTVGDHHEPYKLFVDLSLPYWTRLLVLKSWWNITDIDAYFQLAKNLADTFYRLYTKSKMVDEKGSIFFILASFLRIGSVYLPFAAIGLFHKSHREAYNSYDIKVTYTLLCCTAFVEAFSAHGFQTPMIDNVLPWFYKVSQCSLIGSYASSSIKPCDSSGYIIELVRQHITSGWKDYITDAASYRAFNDHRGQWALQRHNYDKEDLAWSLRLPFDESVLLWHLTTDFCFVSIGGTNEGATRSKEISNYMMYLLLDNPEMLMAGTRRNLFTTAIAELKGILGEERLEYQGLAEKIIAKVESTNKGEPSFIRDACALSKILLSLGDKKMWEVIKDVWVEMLCFSASRCRGYLHAKSLGSGGELLTFVWLLLLHMGMEPLAERLQRVEFPSRGGNGRQQHTEVPYGDERNIGDVPPTSHSSIAINIEEDI